MRKPPEILAKIEHPYAWLWEPLEADPSFVLRAMFGAKAIYLDGRLQFCFTAKEEPWRGVLICTDQGNHASLQEEFAALIPHPILPKWLYLPESSTGFEPTAARLVDLVKSYDNRIGVVPKVRKSKVKKRAVKRPRAKR
jgi:hypothetical protein